MFVTDVLPAAAGLEFGAGLSEGGLEGSMRTRDRKGPIRILRKDVVDLKNVKAPALP